jgi:hypothetical protein
MASNASLITTQQTEITSNATLITGLQTQVTANAALITSLQTQMTSNAATIATLQSEITSNATLITGLQTQVTANATTLSTLQANVGGYYIWANANTAGLYNSILGANTSIATTNANIGSYYTWANANVAGLYTTITTVNTNEQALQANVGGYYIWANANTAGLSSSITAANSVIATHSTWLGNLQANVYANANVASYLPTYSGALTGNGLTINSTAGGDVVSISGPATGNPTQTWKFHTNTGLGGPASWILFPDSSVQTTAYPGSATSLTDLANSVTGANASISSINANIGSYYTWANANVAGLRSSITAANSVISTHGTWLSNLQANNNSLINGSYSLTLNSDGTMTLPLGVINGNTVQTYLSSTNSTGAGLVWRSASGGGVGQAYQNEIYAGINGVTITTFVGVPASLTSGQWVFGINNSILFPDSSQQTTAYPGTATSLTTINTEISTLQANIGSYYTWANANVAAILTNLPAGNITTTGTVKVGSYANIAIATGTASLSALTITGNVYGKSGSPGYLDAITLTNNYSGATNPNKWIRLDSSGDFQIINSAYSATVLQVTDAGIIATGGQSTSSSSLPTSNAISLNNNGYLFDDGNFHIHSSSGAIWINPLDSTNVEIGTQYNSGTGAGIIVQGGVTTNTTNPASHSFFPKVQTNWNVNQPSLAMDNLNVRLNNTSGNNLLIQASAVSGSFTAYITTCEMVAGYSIGSQTNSSGITFTAGTWTSINAIHTLSSGGDVIVATVMDTTTGKIYRVTCMHTNGATNGSIFIERMV